MIDARDMDLVFQALAHANRRQMLDIVKAEPGIVVGELASRFDSSRIAVMKHLNVLEQASLLYSEKDGRTRRLYFNAVPIQMIYDRWTTEYSAYWSGQLTAIKYRAEARVERDDKRKRGRR
jgi:DNA-binding transcriptional ArsR family regulator